MPGTCCTSAAAYSASAVLVESSVGVAAVRSSTSTWLPVSWRSAATSASSGVVVARGPVDGDANEVQAELLRACGLDGVVEARADEERRALRRARRRPF